MHVLKLISALKDRHSIPVLVLPRHSTSSNVMPLSWQAFLGFILNQVHCKACIRSVTACRYRALSSVWITVLSSAAPSVCMLDFRFENGNVDRAPANTASKVRKGPSGASVQHFVIGRPIRPGKHASIYSLTSSIEFGSPRLMVSVINQSFGEFSGRGKNQRFVDSDTAHFK